VSIVAKRSPISATAELFYSHYTRQPALVSTLVKNCTILLEQRFTARMPLLTSSTAFRLGRRR